MPDREALPELPEQVVVVVVREVLVLSTMLVMAQVEAAAADLESRAAARVASTVVPAVEAAEQPAAEVAGTV
jgi:hypothetical protein